MTAKPVSTDEAATASAVDLATVEAVVTHDRSTQPVGPGRIQFKGHSAAAGYPYRILEGQVQALVNDEWVDAPDSQVLEG